jgi:hypothetical protein
MNGTAAKTQKKIDLLRTLIDHPRTGEDERDTARRMLKRLLAKTLQDGSSGRPGHADTRVYGSKYEQAKNMGLAEIAKLMRQDIKLTRKIGQKAAGPGALAVPDPIADMPADIKISITSQYYSGGGAIRVMVKNIPEAWGFIKEEDHWGVMRSVPSPAFAALLVELRVIHFAYNYDNSDITTDYFERNYAGTVDYERPYDLR